MPIYLEYKYSQGYDDYQRNVTKWPSSGESTRPEPNYKFKSPDSGPLSRPRTTGNLKWNLVGHPLKWNASCRSSDFHMGQHRNDSHREDAPDLTGFQLSDGRIRQTGLSCCLDSEFMSHKIRIEICILSFWLDPSDILRMPKSGLKLFSLPCSCCPGPLCCKV